MKQLTIAINNLKNEIFYIGIDVHLISWHVTIQVESLIIFQSNISANWDVFEKIIEPLKGFRVKVAYEAGYFGFKLYDQLTEWGAECLVVAPHLIPKGGGNKVKTDRIDSRLLANYLSKSMLKGIYVPTHQERDHRGLLRERQRLIKDRTRVTTQIKSLFCYQGIEIPDNNGKWTKKYLNQLKQLSPQSYLGLSFHCMFRQLEFCDQEIFQVTKCIKELTKSPQYQINIQLLTSIPGVGLITSMAVLLELHPIDRFSKAEQLAAYVGLTPSQYSSGEHVRMGRITKSGKPYLRALLVEASWTLIKKDEQLKQVFLNIKRRAGAKRAIVAIARRLLLRIRAVLIHQKNYQILPIEHKEAA